MISTKRILFFIISKLKIMFLVLNYKYNSEKILISKILHKLIKSKYTYHTNV
jgi:hypothetical protein